MEQRKSLVAQRIVEKALHDYARWYFAINSLAQPSYKLTNKKFNGNTP